MGLSICLSVRPSCLGDRQRGICLYFSEGGLMHWCCTSVRLSVRPSVCSSVCLSVRPSVSLSVSKMQTLKRDFLKN